ncbi:hypothetical protein GB937_000076 [Aspergillus fischeri]|nr:hypothetical protein GB937_000076 [Aspergillus fischeri]
MAPNGWLDRGIATAVARSKLGIENALIKARKGPKVQVVRNHWLGALEECTNNANGLDILEHLNLCNYLRRNDPTS